MIHRRHNLTKWITVCFILKFNKTNNVSIIKVFYSPTDVCMYVLEN
jgi:hypothetical protein